MKLRIGVGILAMAMIALACASASFAQQKAQYVPGQYGLNAGVAPDPGFTYQSLTINYSAGQLNDGNGNKIPAVNGTYSFWAVENIFMYVPKHKFLGGYFAPYIVVPFATGSLDADLGIPPSFSAQGGGVGFADIYVQPLNLAWHLKRADINAGYGFTAPTGRFTEGATDNVGSGYWGNDFTTNSTFYLTKNRGTQASLSTVWEIHGEKSGTDITPGQAFSTEWAVGQTLPLKKDFSRLLQIGLIGYDQWQLTANGGDTRTFPFYSVHAIGVQTNFILPAKSLNFFFKYEDEYRALARPEGRTIGFGVAWTLRIPKPQPPAAPKS